MSHNSMLFDAQKGLRSMIELSWSTQSREEVAVARKRFEEYTRQGWLAFTVGSDNRKHQIYEFDPVIEKIFLVPLAPGG